VPVTGIRGVRARLEELALMTAKTFGWDGMRFRGPRPGGFPIPL
jgi:hypothetical protein